MTGRIRERASFGRFRTEGRRFRHGVVWCSWVDDAAATPPRVAYAIGRTTGGAVVRNRLRRRLRALVAEQATDPGLVAGLYLLGVGTGASNVTFTELRADVTNLNERIRATVDHG